MQETIMARGLPRTLARAAARSAGSAPAKAGLSAVTTGTGGTYKTVFTLTAMAISVTDALAYASQKLFDFSAGKIRIKGGTASLAFAVTSTRASTINDSAAMDWSLGSAAASNVALATTMVDIAAKVDKTLDGAAAAYTTASTADIAAASTLDGTATAVDLYLNVAFPTIAEIDGDGTLAVTGTITLLWENWGDNA
jgi:hypothetical protein